MNKFPQPLLKTEASFAIHKKSWFATFEKHFQTVCASILKAQGESAISAISFLDYTMKYANFVNRQYVAEVWVYDDKRYLDNAQRMIGEYDMSFLFAHFDELWSKLLDQRKRYVGKVSSQEITSLMIRSLPKFYAYLVSVARFAIVDCVDKKPFTDIVKNDVFRVRVGGYMAKTEPVFTQKKNKNVGELVDWFSERLKFDYIFEDCSGLDFSSRNFTNTVFRYAQFRNAILNNAYLLRCSLIGTSFYNAQLESCRLDKSTVYEADFSYANMKNASLVYVRGRAGLSRKEEWRQVGFLPVIFRNTDLTAAEFIGAKLAGADFSCANLTDANFTGADLSGADFSDAIMDGVVFTDANLDGAMFKGTGQKSAGVAKPKSEVAAFGGSICPRAEYMHCYVMEMAGDAYLPKVPKGEDTEIVNVSGFNKLNKIDYDTRNEVISERLKLLMEQYMPDYDFVPIVYYDAEKVEQNIYWRFKPPLYEGFHVAFRSDGVVSHISFPIEKAPIVFTARSPKGVRSIVVRMAVAESVLRRSILGLKFTKILDLA